MKNTRELFDAINTSYTDLKNRLQIVVDDLNGEYSITSEGTYVLSLKGNSTISVNLPENSTARVVIKQTGSFSCTVPDCFKDTLTLSSNSGDVDVLEFTNYGKLRGIHADQY